MPRRNRRVWTGPASLSDWPADLRPLLTQTDVTARRAQLGTEGACRWSGKARYPDEQTARTALVGALVVHNRGRAQRREQRAYRCDGCGGGWHLTSLRTPPAHAIPQPRPAADTTEAAVSGAPATIDVSQPADRSHP